VAAILTHRNPFLRRARRAAAFTAVIFIALSLASCGGDASPQVRYGPPLLPIEFVIDDDGISVEGDTSISTPIGSFSVGAKYQLPYRDPGTIYVLIRNRGYDQVYNVKTGGGEFTAVVDGRTTIQIRDGQVLIDVSEGQIHSIKFQRMETAAASAGDDQNWWDHQQTKWNQGYESSWYHPFALSRWAYDDGTISQWCGLGFIWFLIRLFLALILGVIDVFLSLIFVIAQIIYMFAGSTGRNIVWGLACILGVIGVFAFFVLLNE
jgi:hypothetical protein